MTNDRILYQDNKRENRTVSLLEEASSYAGGIFDSVQKTAETTYCKGVQILKIREFVIQRGCWIVDASSLGIYVDRGSANEVYLSEN